MAFDPVPSKLKRLWDSWNLRGIVILSLSLQALLILLAPLRKRTRNVVINSLVWSAYLLADWAAAFAVGLISSRQVAAGDDITGDLLVLWAPFLLVHLGGPDTITAFALEDNALWFRHFVGLLFQAVAAVYVFLLTLPKNEVLVPTILMFVAGLIKYGERTRALYLGSMEQLKEFQLGKPNPGPDYEQFMEEYNLRAQTGIPVQIKKTDPKRSDLYSEMKSTDDGDAGRTEQSEIVNAYNFFSRFKGLVGESTFTYNDREESVEFFRAKEPEEVLKVLSVELNFFYEMLFTKSQVVHSMWGHIRRLVCFSCVLACLVLFIQVKNKHGFHKFDVTVTYALIGGAIVLDTIAVVMLVLSDWTAAVMKKSVEKSRLAVKLNWILGPILRLFLLRKKQRWYPADSPEGYKWLATPVMFRRWSESICAFNLLEYCLNERLQRTPKPRDFCSSVLIKIIHLPSDIFAILKCSFRLSGQALFCCMPSPVRDKVSGFLGEIVRWILGIFGLEDVVDRIRYVEENPFLDKLWDQIVNKLWTNSKRAFDLQAVRRICEGRGDMALDDWPEDEVSVLKRYIEMVDYDQSILIWHIATDICYHLDEYTEGNSDGHREYSKILSDYMLYLLIMQGNMMTGVAGIGQVRFQDTCAEAKRFFKKTEFGKKKLKEACVKLIGVETPVNPVTIKGDESKSVLFDACILAKNLMFQEGKWKIASAVWIEMLCYAASQCRADAHFTTLSKGGELVTFVWLLMFHLGLTDHFQSTKSHGTVKLVASK